MRQVDVLVLAELPGVASIWKQALEGWNVRVSQQVLEWQAEAEVRTWRDVLLRLLEAHCGAKAPADVVTAVQASTDLEKLTRWFDAALNSRTYDEFRAVLRS